MRGTPTCIRVDLQSRGIIPAYAGNTRSHGFDSGNRRDHPRVCGEHFGTARGGGTHRGSSPRMRGTRICSQCGENCRGIIPAYAGNTNLLPMRRELPWDHPRVCGEHVTPWRDSEAILGSSPRMRGTRTRQILEANTTGIIPAYAGNTLWTELTCAPRRDHPRVCGEHVLFLIGRCMTPGSSPRMRGTRTCSLHATCRCGIIPAYAGNTAPYAPSISQYRGSSPRMRGTRFR